MRPNRAVYGAIFSACFLLFNPQTLWAEDNPGEEAAQRGNQFTSQYGSIKTDLKNIIDDAKKLGDNVKTAKDPQKSLSDLRQRGYHQGVAILFILPRGGVAKGAKQAT